ncbi:type II CAAX endopeptidase family protein [Actinomyces oris]|uniref:type II CAAX endopeptidase family protein n=1 Tax=Actinomyces oris TaxID=544580 RepID=UPI0028E4D250|nr:type II CAAX endopeptidase family protein [Actinomyces oris]
MEFSSTLSSLESSDLNGDRSDQDHHLTMGGKVVRIVIAFAMMFACALMPGVVALIPPLRSFAAAHPHPQGNAGDLAIGAFIVVVYGVATILALILCFVLRRSLDRGRSVRLRLQVDCRAMRWMVGMILIAVAVELAVAGLIHALGMASGDRAAPDLPWWAMVVATLSQAFLLQAVPEETVWRGWLFSSLGETRCAAVSSVLGFTAVHLFSQGGQHNLLEHLTYLAGPCGFAVTALIVRMISGSTWAAIGVHGGFLVANDALTDRLHLPVGSITWILQGVIWAAVGLFILAFHRRRQRLSGQTC